MAGDAHGLAAVRARLGNIHNAVQNKPSVVYIDGNYQLTPIAGWSPG